MINFIEIPKFCPICGGETQIIDNNGVKVLMCLNQGCEGKLINRLDHFVGKKGLDIKGLSKATLEKLINIPKGVAVSIFSDNLGKMCENTYLDSRG